MPFAETRAQIPAPMLADYDAAVKSFIELSVSDRLMLRRLWVMGPSKLDQEYHTRMTNTNLVCGIATSSGFLMGATLMGGMLCNIYNDKFQEDFNNADGSRL